MTPEELEREYNLDRLRRKRDQAWELAGLARMDGDAADERRWSETAHRISARIAMLKQEEA